MTRIAIDYTAAVRQGGGIGRYTRSLVEAVAALDHARRYVLFSAGRDPVRRAWPPNFTRRELPLEDRHLARVWHRLRLPLPVELITGRVDILHAPDFALPPTLGAHTVLTVHDLSFMRYPACSPKPLLDYLLAAVPRSVRRAEVILADSQSTRADIVELLRVPEERVVVLYAGVEPRFVRQDGTAIAAVRERYGLRRPFLLGLGTLQPRKNFPRLIRACHLLRERHHIPHQLVIGGGRGWLYEEIEETIVALGVQEHVKMVGFVRDEDLPALYSAAEVFAFPSLYEGFGIPILEAMGCGTPVVTATASSLPEVAGEAALMVGAEDVEALADALWRALDDGALRQTLIARGLAQVQRFTWSSAAAQLLDIYKRWE
jgi:glycosyltransferase involved in cell wall biosynthesis